MTRSWSRSRAVRDRRPAGPGVAAAFVVVGCHAGWAGALRICGSAARYTEVPAGRGRPESPSMGPRPARCARRVERGWWPIMSDDSAVVRLAPRVSSLDGPRGGRGRRLCFLIALLVVFRAQTLRTIAASSFRWLPSPSS